MGANVPFPYSNNAMSEDAMSAFLTGAVYDLTASEGSNRGSVRSLAAPQPNVPSRGVWESEGVQSFADRDRAESRALADQKIREHRQRSAGGNAREKAIDLVGSGRDEPIDLDSSVDSAPGGDDRDSAIDLDASGDSDVEVAAENPRSRLLSATQMYSCNENANPRTRRRVRRGARARDGMHRGRAVGYPP